MNSRQKNKKVSVIIPTHKRAGQIRRALESVAKQTYENIETIVIDDNANDQDERKKTAAIVNEFKNITLIQNTKQLGGALSRNKGIKRATGKYVAFLDDDDEYLPSKIETQLAFMQKNNLDVSFSNELIYDGNGKFLYKESHETFDGKNILKYHLVKKIIGPQTFMYKTKVLLDIGGFDDVPSGQEYVLMYKTILAGYKIGYLDAYLVKIYFHDGERISNGNKKIQGEKQLYELKKKHFNILNFFEKENVRFEWAFSRYDYSRVKGSPKRFYYLLILLIRFTVPTTKAILKKVHKAIKKRI